MSAGYAEAQAVRDRFHVRRTAHPAFRYREIVDAQAIDIEAATFEDLMFGIFATLAKKPTGAQRLADLKDMIDKAIQDEATARILRERERVGLVETSAGHASNGAGSTQRRP